MKILLFTLALFTFGAAAAQQNCVCTAGCKIASDPYPPPATGQPASCTVYKAGVVLATAAATNSTNVPLNNATVCQPASPNYNSGPSGSVACLVAIPAQAAGTVTLTMTATNPAGETAQSAPFTFQSVSTLSTLPNVPVNLRAN